MSDLKIGDKVRLTIGGYEMLVDGVDIENFRADCIWVDQQGKIQRDNFAVDNLERQRPAKL